MASSPSLLSLPLEIRSAIWKMCIPHERVVSPCRCIRDVRLTSSSLYCSPPKEYALRWKQSILEQSCPALLTVSRQVHVEVLHLLKRRDQITFIFCQLRCLGWTLQFMSASQLHQVGRIKSVHWKKHMAGFWEPEDVKMLLKREVERQFKNVDYQGSMTFEDDVRGQFLPLQISVGGCKRVKERYFLRSSRPPSRIAAGGKRQVAALWDSPPCLDA